MPRALYGFHNGRWPWCTWVQARAVHGIISVMMSAVWRLWTTVPGCCDSPWAVMMSKGPSDDPCARAGAMTAAAAAMTHAMPSASLTQDVESARCPVADLVGIL